MMYLLHDPDVIHDSAHGVFDICVDGDEKQGNFESSIRNSGSSHTLSSRLYANIHTHIHIKNTQNIQHDDYLWRTLKHVLEHVWSIMGWGEYSLFTCI